MEKLCDQTFLILQKNEVWSGIHLKTGKYVYSIKHNVWPLHSIRVKNILFLVNKLKHKMHIFYL